VSDRGDAEQLGNFCAIDVAPLRKLAVDSKKLQTGTLNRWSMTVEYDRCQVAKPQVLVGKQPMPAVETADACRGNSPRLPWKQPTPAAWR
jgi:hypothetical protein